MSGEKKLLLKQLLLKPVSVAKHFTGFDLLGDLHNEWIKTFIMPKNHETTLLAHRESYKTTSVEIALALLVILFPNDAILFMRKTGGDVAEVKMAVENLLKSELFREFSKIIHGKPIQFEKNTCGEITTNLKTISRGTGQLTFLGIGTSITGKHFDRIFTDDICNKEDRISKAEREKTKYTYQELHNLLNRGGYMINTGTPWHKDDVIETMMDNKMYYDCYSTGLMTPEQIEEKKRKFTHSLFCANYELKHIMDTDALFTEEKYITDERLLYDCIGHIDAGYGGDDATAFTLIKPQKDGRLIVLGKRYELHVNKCLPEIKAFCDEFRCGTIWCEDNGDKGYLADKITKEYGLYAKTYRENQNKYDKISTHLYGAWDRIYFLESRTDKDYINEILEYNEFSTSDDCPDSLSNLCRMLNKRPSIEFI